MATTLKRKAMTDLQKAKIAEKKNEMFCKKKELLLRAKEVETDAGRALVEKINCLKSILGVKESDVDDEYEDGYESNMNKKPMLPLLDEREIKRVKMRLMLLIDQM